MSALGRNLLKTFVVKPVLSSVVRNNGTKIVDPDSGFNSALSVVDNFAPIKTSGSWWENTFNGQKVEQELASDWKRAEMEYQTYMSNTAYQRAVADMKKAGLNPYMIYSNGSVQASSPSMTGYSHSKGRNFGDNIGQLFSTALQVGAKVLTALL